MNVTPVTRVKCDIFQIKHREMYTFKYRTLRFYYGGRQNVMFAVYSISSSFSNLVAPTNYYLIGVRKMCY